MLPIQFGYWNIRGLMQPIRFLCEYLHIEWSEKQYDLKIKENGQRDTSHWLNEKTTLHLNFPNLPWMIDTENNIRLTQSDAILRYIAKKYSPSLLGTTLQEQANVDMVSGVLNDLKLNITRVAYEKKEKYDAALKQFLPIAENQLLMLIEFLGNKPYLIGNDLTYVDFVCYEVFYVLRLMIPEMFLLPTFQTAVNFICLIEQLPRIADYIKLDKVIKLPINNKTAGMSLSI